MSGPETSPARVVAGTRESYRILSPAGDALAQVAGRLRHDGVLPVVGDWVAVQGPNTIVAVLPRRTQLTRAAAGTETAAQVLAANVDTAFLVNGLDGDFNVRRIERYLVLLEGSGVRPVVVLNKLDCCDDPEVAASLIRDVPVHMVSARDQVGLEALAPYLAAGQTVAVLGSSGVGKSTLVNHWLQEDRLETGEVRAADSRGRHTTTHRELFVLPCGGLLIDTPGMRELQLWDGVLEHAFRDVAEQAPACRFRDCRHDREPGCAVRGALSDDRLLNYHKLRRELHHQAGRQKQKAASNERRHWKRVKEQHVPWDQDD